MQIERTSAVLRQRSAYEAIDFGCALCRSWWSQLTVAWLLVALPFAALLNVVFWQYPWVAALVLWWLKPFFDRFPLAVASRAMFGEQLGIRELARHWPRLIGSGLLAALTWRRFSLWRSYTMPIDQLESVRGVDRQQRLAVLHRSYTGSATLLTMFCLLCETVVYVGILSFFAFLASNWVDIEGAFAELTSAADAPLWQSRVNNVLLFAATCLVEPFFVTIGFGLYINRRVELEGWDIELAFRRLQKRLSHTAASVNVPLLALLLLLPKPSAAIDVADTQANNRIEGTSSNGVTDPVATSLAANASDPNARTLDDDTEAQRSACRQAIDEVLQAPEFGQKKTVWRWQLQEHEKKDEPQEDVDFSGFADIGRFLATVLLWLLVLSAAVFVAVLVAALWRARDGKQVRTSTRTGAPEVLFGLDLRPETLPADVAAAARALWQQGQARAAMSLLYRAALSHLVWERELEIPASATEGECLNLVLRLRQQVLEDAFATLTHAWQQTAYAHRLPTTETFELLCRDWETQLRGRV